MRTAARVLTALTAATAAGAIVVGVPVVLWQVGRSVIAAVPPRVPVMELLLRPDDGAVLMGFLVLVGACAWFVLALSIVLELVTALMRRPAPRIDLPGFRLGRSIAGALVAAMVGSGPAIAAPAASVSSVELAGFTPAMAQPQPDEPAGPVHVVAQRDSLWRIAETTLGDPLRWREIYDLNAGRPQPDGGRLTEASLLTVGWELVLPADARPTVRVAPGDTLTELAAEHLGDPGHADELHAANLTRPQPGGAVLDDPDLIRPGWTLVLPEPEPTRPPPTEPPPAPTRPDDHRRPVPPPGPETTTPETTTPPPDAGRIGVGTVPAGENAAGPAVTVAALGVSSLVVGGVAAALAVRRRRQLRLRPPRHRVAVPDDDAGRVEWSTAHPAPTTSTARLDLALRALPAPGPDDPVPQLRAARLTDDDVLLTLAGPGSLPAPFVAVGGHDWTLDADQPLTVPEAAGRCAPFPTLASVATDTDRTLLVDLEQRGVLRIGGDRERCVAFLRHLAAELATSRMAEDVEVFLVGLDDALPTLNPEQLVVLPDLADALGEVEHRAAATRAAIARYAVGSVVEGRLREIAPDSWLPTVLLVAHEPDHDARTRLDLLADTAAGTTAVAVVVIDTTGPELRIHDDGTLHLPDVEDGPWQAAQLTRDAGDQLCAILGATAETAVPVGAAQHPDTWAAGMQDDGSLDPRNEPHDSAEADPDDGPDERPDPDGDLGTPAAALLPRPQPPGPGPDPAAARRLAIVEHQDPRLDDDLAAWRADGPPSVPMIAILGEPAVRAPGTRPAARPSWFAEVLVYLSLHPAGVTAAKAVTDLWPDGHRISAATIRHAFYGARRWAGRGFGGDPRAPFVSDMQTDSTYRLRGHLLDWDLFRRLRKRAQARHAAGHPGAVADYEAALALVRGPVLTALRPGGYAWLNNHDQRHDLQIPGFVVDAAHELVDIALAAGDTATARRAAEQARVVDIDVAFDRPLTDLMRIAHAEDNRSELELYAAVLLDARGFDVPEELAPESFAVLNELLPAGPRRPRP